MVIFDISQENFEYWFFAFPFGFVVLADIAFLFILRSDRKKGIKTPGAHIITVGGLFLFGTFVSAVLFFGPLLNYFSYRTILASGEAEWIEGTITNFTPMPIGGHGNESFVINGRKFSYSSYYITPGFKSTQVDGGPLREGMKVKIWYHNGVILRIETPKEI